MAQLDRLFTGFILLFVMSFLAIGYFYYQYSWGVFYFPFATGIVIICLCIFVLCRHRPDQSTGRSPQPSITAATGTIIDTRQPTGAWSGILWVLASVPFVIVFGYLFGLALYVLVFMRTHGQGWALSLTMFVGTLATIYLVFMSLLRVSLPLFPHGVT